MSLTPKWCVESLGAGNNCARAHGAEGVRRLIGPRCGVHLRGLEWTRRAVSTGE